MNIKTYLLQHFLTPLACSAVLVSLVHPALAIQNVVVNGNNNRLLLA